MYRSTYCFDLIFLIVPKPSSSNIAGRVDALFASTSSEELYFRAAQTSWQTLFPTDSSSRDRGERKRA
jgi:hypothetical protein